MQDNRHPVRLIVGDQCRPIDRQPVLIQDVAAARNLIAHVRLDRQHNFLVLALRVRPVVRSAIGTGTAVILHRLLRFACLDGDALQQDPFRLKLAPVDLHLPLGQLVCHTQRSGQLRSQIFSHFSQICVWFSHARSHILSRQ